MGGHRSFGTLGPTAGNQTTLATSEGEELAGSPVVFTHTVTAGNASGVLIVDGNNQTAPPRTTLPEDLVVQVVDEAGNPVVAAAVTWVVTEGGGTLDPRRERRTRTAARLPSGRSARRPAPTGHRRLSPASGRPSSPPPPPREPPARSARCRATTRIGPAGTTLASPLVIQVLDDADNPVGNVPVTWTVESGGGSVAPGSAATGADGQASTVWTLGPSTGRPSGCRRLRPVRAPSGSRRLRPWERRPSSDWPPNPRATRRSGVPFGRQPVVQVRDAAGNPVQAPGVLVTAAIASGAGQLVGTRTQTTGANGRATFTNLGIAGATGTHTLIFAAGGTHLRHLGRHHRQPGDDQHPHHLRPSGSLRSRGRASRSSSRSPPLAALPRARCRSRPQGAPRAAAPTSRRAGAPSC